VSSLFLDLSISRRGSGGCGFVVVVIVVPTGFRRIHPMNREQAIKPSPFDAQGPVE